MLSLGCLLDGLPYPAEPLGGGAEAELLPGVEAVGSFAQSAPQPVVSGVLWVTVKDGETPNSVGEVGV